MDIRRAKEILTILADGIDPISGENLPEEDCCNQPEIIRALYAVLQALGTDEKQVDGNRPQNAGKAWMPDEDKELLFDYQSGLTVYELAEKYMRTPNAIAARLVLLGEIADRKTALQKRK